MSTTFQFFNPAAKVTITHGHLPHWDQANATYFITWRTADSIPREIWLRWREERDAWLLAHDINPVAKDWRFDFEMLDEAARDDFRQFARALEKELDATRYTLGDYAIMPNHVHLLVGGLPRQAMLKQVESWKKWTAIQINEALNRSGRFWQDESFDHLVRNEASFGKFRAYIAKNPVTARLKPHEFILWQRTSS
ncbi:transposase [Prosthecobacter sp.]|uniref:transposase n=1 Tax=Prosthecobacter sp. TaxID=1965333 RepID=UPI002ABA3D0B|nr:transposase [Prosthecobacter sp.]MDZ4403847.1 transposase [Prosthecobacter sp.]